MYTFSNAVTVNNDTFVTTIIFLMVGIFIAMVYTSFVKKLRGEFIMALIDSGAFDELSAKTPDELGIKMGFLRRIAIKRSSSFSPDYIAIGDKETKYYIEQDSIPRLTSKYGNEGITLLQFFLTLIAFIAVALVMVTAVPQILNMINF